MMVVQWANSDIDEVCSDQLLAVQASLAAVLLSLP
jgi:hypothetical protein